MGVLAAATLISLWCLPWLSLLFIALFLFTGWFFRDPQRHAEAPENAVLAPADGRVVEIAITEEPQHIQGPAIKIAIFMSVFDVHVNRAPCAGTVESVERQRGRFLNAMKPQASIVNEQLRLALRTAGRPVLLKLIAGLIARRIVCRLTPGEALLRGQRIGMIKFGSRAELFLPKSGGFAVAVRLGQKVRAGETVLGIWQ